MMQSIFGSSVDAIARNWRAGSVNSDTAMDRIHRLLPLGDREEYLCSLAGTTRAAQAIVEREILARRASEIANGKEVV